MHLQLEFECITKLWHWRLGANARSFVLVPKVEHVVNGELEILYESVYQGDEVIVLVWCSKPRLGHYRWLHRPLFQILGDRKTELFARIIRHIMKFLQIE
jgi:hypothetical protein